MIDATGATKAAYDVVIVGAGPAGLAAAATTAGAGLATLLLDENASPGGQIYRAVTTTPVEKRSILGEDYWAGARLVAEARASGAEIVQGATVWSLDSSLEMGVSVWRRLAPVEARRVILATGALERPFPDSGLDIARRDDGRRRADAAEGLGPRPRRPSGPGRHWAAVVAVGCATAAGGRTHRGAARHDATTQLSARACRTLPAFCSRPISPRDSPCDGRWRDRCASSAASRSFAPRATGALRKSPMSQVPAPSSACTSTCWRCIRAWCRTSIWRWPPASRTAGIRCNSAGRRCSMQPAIASVRWHRHRGRRRGIGGALAAEARGRLAGAGCRGGGRARTRRASSGSPGAGPGRCCAAERGRAFLDQLFAPPPQFRMPEGDTIVCRCEEVTAAQIARRRRHGCGGTQPAQGVPALRHGTVPGPALRPHRHRADRGGARHDSRGQVGYYRLRPPVKPITLAELAAMAHTDRAVEAVVPR